MATMVASGLFNAFAFAGAGFLFSKLNHNGYQDKIKRHNFAMEKLTKDKEKWFERETERKDKILRYRLELAEANKDLDQTNKALVLFKKAQAQQEMDLERKLEHYYHPGEEMSGYIKLVKNGAMIMTSISVGKLLSFLL